MASLAGYREQIQHELFDTLVRGVGLSTVSQKTKLFSPANVGQPELTNMQEGGRLSNEEVFLILSLRIYVQFAFNTATDPGPTGNPAWLHRWMEDGIMWTLNVGNKPQLGPLPLFVAPGAGGMYGYDVTDNAFVLTNGTPDWKAALKLAKPIKIEKNQHFSVDTEFYTFQSLDGTTKAIDPLALLNADDSLKIIKVFLGGILERSVQ
jgi:hypothetical protein